MHDWNTIRRYYTEAHELIALAGRNEWGLGAYDWEEIGIRFTPIEEALWAHIRGCDAVLYPQYPVGRFFVDFANPVARVAIECDGAAYHTDKAKDAARDADLERMGWVVYRIPGYDCVKDNDPETGEARTARLFVQGICDRHGISRNTRTTDDEWHSMDEGLDAILATPGMRAAARRFGGKL